MSSTATQQSLNHRAAMAFDQYVSGGRSLTGGIVFFLESAEHLDEVRRVSGANDIVIAPQGENFGDSDQSLIRYSGVFVEPGDEMTFNDRHTFELQDYLAAPYISIVGLTLVRLGSAAGLRAYLQDAEAAHRDGTFVDQLLSSAVLVDSRESFFSDVVHTDLVRVHVSVEGEFRDGADGLLLGHVGDELGALQEAVSAGPRVGRSFARIVPPQAFEAELAARPWLPRYVRALDLIRRREGSHTGVAVSGFGGHFLSALDEVSTGFAILDPDAPFLLKGNDEEYILVEWTSRRRFRLGFDAARICEALVATGNETDAVGLLSASGLGGGEALMEPVREIRQRFLSVGVDLAVFAEQVA